MSRKTVLLCMLGSTLAPGADTEPSRRCHPVAAVARNADLPVDRIELLFGLSQMPVAEAVTSEIKALSPETAVVRHPLQASDIWDYEEVFGSLYDFADAYPFDPERERYLVHLGSGEQVIQISLLQLVSSRRIPAGLLWTRDEPGSCGASFVPYGIIEPETYVNTFVGF